MKKKYPIEMNYGCFMPLCILALLGLLYAFNIIN